LFPFVFIFFDHSGHPLDDFRVVTQIDDFFNRAEFLNVSVKDLVENRIYLFLVTDATDGTAIDTTVGISSLFGYKCVQSTDINGEYYIRNCSVVAVNPHLWVSGGSRYNDKWIDLEITSSLQTINVALERKTQ
jgi:hypothetical protein